MNMLSALGRSTYREWLGRTWDVSLPSLLFVMLNPSTADDFIDDATIRKIILFAKLLGFGSISVVNLWDYRATYPKALKLAGYPRSSRCDAVIRREAGRHEFAICAWGANARARPDRVAEVIELLEAQNCTPMALRLLSDGTPEHPLYLPLKCRPVEFLA